MDPWTSYIQPILQVLHDSGVAAGPIFALMWWLERSERLNTLKNGEENAQKRDEALNDVRIALTTLTAILDRGTRR